MAIGIVSDEEFEKEISRTPASIPNKPIVVQIPKGGRNEGDVNVPEALRKIIGDEQVQNGRQAALNLAHSLGISDSSVSAYAVGSHSTANYGSPNPALKVHVKDARAKLAVKARNRLNATLNAITPNKLEDAKLRDLASVATAMSSVVRQMEGEKSGDEDDLAKRPVVVLFAPKPRREEEYETIIVDN